MVLNRQRRVRVAVRPLAEFLRRVQRSLHLPTNEVTVCLVSDEEMTRLNQVFRGGCGSTDVLSFPAKGVPLKRKNSQVVVPPTSYLGDVAISPETARRNARRFSRTLPQELHILILHGVLHLAGYDHETDQGEMDRLERRLRKRLGMG